MAIPTTHLVRKEYVYEADDGQRYRTKFEQALCDNLTAMPAPGAGDNNLPKLPPNIKPRGFYIETTNGTDAQNRPHKYRRFVPCTLNDVIPTGVGAAGHVIAAFEGCAWKVRGYRGEKYRFR
ncbi:MAG: hypothetical protein ABJA67_05560 [Chthonomonadales bacterium]